MATVTRQASSHPLVTTGALISLGVTAWDLKAQSANRTVVVKTVGAVVLVWGLIFVLSEVSEQLGNAVAVFVTLVFLVARRGVVQAVSSRFGG